MKKPFSTTDSATTTPILSMIQRLAQSALDSGMERVVIATPLAEDLVLRPGVQVSSKELTGPRVAIKGDRPYGNASLTTARWEEDQQETTRSPSLTCVVGGHTDLRLGNYILHANEGTMILIPPGVPHPSGRRAHLEPPNDMDGSCDLLAIVLRGQRIQCWVCHSRGPQHIDPQSGENIFLLDEQSAGLLNMLTHESVSGRSRSGPIREGLLCTLLLTLQREIEEGRFLHLHDAAQQDPHLDNAFDPIAYAQQYIVSHLNQPLTLETMARLVYTSRAQFAKRFRAQTGRTFTEYMSHCRLQQAQIFLRETSWAVPQIAEFVGFKSASHFHHLFQRKVGMPPMEYRRRHAAKDIENETDAVA
jgi:AraC-like DNA-binding protein